jgi:hypothetical protein
LRSSDGVDAVASGSLQVQLEKAVFDRGTQAGRLPVAAAVVRSSSEGRVGRSDGNAFIEAGVLRAA